MEAKTSMEKAEALLPLLSDGEKEELIKRLYALRNQRPRGITKTPGVCGGRACIEGTRIPVWTLVHFRMTGLKENEILYNFPGLIPQDLKNAWAYHQAMRRKSLRIFPSRMLSKFYSRGKVICQ